MTTKLFQIVSKQKQLRELQTTTVGTNIKPVNWWQTIKNIVQIIRRIIEMYDLIIEYLISKENGADK